MVNQSKELLDLNKIMIDSSIKIIKEKLEQIQERADVEESVKSILKYINTIINNIKRLEDLECYNAGMFNGNFKEAEIVVLKILEGLLKDLDALISLQEDRIRFYFLISNMHREIDKATSILEKYIFY